MQINRLVNFCQGKYRPAFSLRGFKTAVKCCPRNQIRKRHQFAGFDGKTIFEWIENAGLQRQGQYGEK